MEAEAVHYNSKFNDADFIDGEIPEETPAEAPKKPKDKRQGHFQLGVTAKTTVEQGNPRRDYREALEGL